MSDRALWLARVQMTSPVWTWCGFGVVSTPRFLRSWRKRESANIAEDEHVQKYVYAWATDLQQQPGNATTFLRVLHGYD